MLWVLPFPVSIVLPYSFLLPSTLYYCFSITYDKWYYFLWILKTHTKLMNQKVFLIICQCISANRRRLMWTEQHRHTQTGRVPASWSKPWCYPCHDALEFLIVSAVSSVIPFGICQYIGSTLHFLSSVYLHPQSVPVHEDVGHNPTAEDCLIESSPL